MLTRTFGCVSYSSRSEGILTYEDKGTEFLLSQE